MHKFVLLSMSNNVISVLGRFNYYWNETWEESKKMQYLKHTSIYKLIFKQYGLRIMDYVEMM